MTVTAISAVVPRRRTTLAGRIDSVTNHARPWAWVDVALSDGTGTITLRFLGRRAVPGLRPGRSLTVEGTPSHAGPLLIMLNPLYSFRSDQVAARCHR
jgi:hypothetical protein